MEEFVQTSNVGLVIEDSIDYYVSEEAVLIEQAKDDPLAFGKLFDRYYDVIFTFIMHRTANVALAEEISSNTFFKALEKLRTFRWQNIPFSAWLYRIASNEINEYFRKKKRYRHIPIEGFEDRFSDETNNADKEIIEKEKILSENKLFFKLHKEISVLKYKYQEVIILKYFDDKSIKEICEITGKSEGTVKSLLHRAIEKLRKVIDLSDISEG
jgi:RNA polymerase sigma-70 factor (ECF subfamily)